MFQREQEEARARGEAGSEEAPPLVTLRSSAGHTLEVSLMMNLSDQIQQLNQTLIAVNLPKGKRPPKIHPLPRPVGKLELKRREAEQNAVDEALSQFGIYN